MDSRTQIPSPQLKQDPLDNDVTLIDIRIEQGYDTKFFHKRKQSEPFQTLNLRTSLQSIGNDKSRGKYRKKHTKTSIQVTQQLSHSRNNNDQIQQINSDYQRLMNGKYRKRNKFYSIRSSIEMDKYEQHQQNIYYSSLSKAKQRRKEQNNSSMLAKRSIDNINQSQNIMQNQSKFPLITKTFNNLNPNLNSTLYMKHQFQKRNFIYYVPSRDSTIDAATNAAQRRWERFQRMKEQMSQLQETSNDLTQKKKILQEVKQNYPGLKLSQNDILKYSSSDLQDRIQKQLFNAKLNNAATRIQSYFRMFQQRRKLQEYTQKRTEAKDVIARAWKKQRWLRLANQHNQLKKNSAASDVQKHLKGFLARKNIIGQVLDRRAASAQEYFRKKRLQILTDSQIIIRYYWLRYKKEQEKLIKLQALKNIQVASPIKGLNNLRKQNSKQVYFDKFGPSWGFSNTRKNTLPLSKAKNQ